MSFGLLGGLSVDEWWKEMDRTEEEDKKERKLAEINERLSVSFMAVWKTGRVNPLVSALMLAYVWYINDALISRYWCLLKDPKFLNIFDGKKMRQIIPSPSVNGDRLSENQALSGTESK